MTVINLGGFLLLLFTNRFPLLAESDLGCKGRVAVAASGPSAVTV